MSQTRKTPEIEIICDYILEYAEKHNRPLSRLSLNYVLYILYIMFLDKFDKPLYGEHITQHNFTAWKLGPVVVEEYFRHTFEPHHAITGIVCEKDLSDYFTDYEHYYIDCVLDYFIEKTIWNLINTTRNTYAFQNTECKHRIDWHDIIRSREYFRQYDVMKGG